MKLWIYGVALAIGIGFTAMTIRANCGSCPGDAKKDDSAQVQGGCGAKAAGCGGCAKAPDKAVQGCGKCAPGECACKKDKPAACTKCGTAECACPKVKKADAAPQPTPPAEKK